MTTLPVAPVSAAATSSLKSPFKSATTKPAPVPPNDIEFVGYDISANDCTDDAAELRVNERTFVPVL
jgi:hypothetical protein